MGFLFGVGMFGVEFFFFKDGNVLLNEVVLRFYNCGYYIIELCFVF